MLDFFPNVDRKRNRFAACLIFSGDRTALFDPAVSDKIGDLEDYFRLRLVLRHAKHFQQSVRRFRTNWERRALARIIS
jgi:hypothetical protein